MKDRVNSKNKSSFKGIDKKYVGAIIKTSFETQFTVNTLTRRVRCGTFQRGA